MVLGVVLIALAATDFRLFRDDDHGTRRAHVAPVAHFDAARAFADVRRQVDIGPRPAGSPRLRRLAETLRRRLPGGHFEPYGRRGERNIVGTLAGRPPAIALVAHYDTKDLTGFVGANDGAGGTAAVLELARVLARGRPAGARELRFVLFDGEEAPSGVPESRFVTAGLRGSKAYARAHAAEIGELVLLDFVANPDLQLPREASSNPALWARLRAAATRIGAAAAFPDRTRGAIHDDHSPFLSLGVPAIDLIDFHYPCFHRRCDDLAHVSPASIGLAGRAVEELVRGLH